MEVGEKIPCYPKFVQNIPDCGWPMNLTQGGRAGNSDSIRLVSPIPTNYTTNMLDNCM